jgi:hypothetical protein
VREEGGNCRGRRRRSISEGESRQPGEERGGRRKVVRVRGEGEGDKALLAKLEPISKLKNTRTL